MKLTGSWPRGKYNGRRITGFTLKLRLDVSSVHWKPRWDWGFGAPLIQWLVFQVVAEAVYHWAD